MTARAAAPLSVFAVVIAAGLAAPALAADVTVRAVTLDRYETGGVTISPGDRLVFTNTDALAQHNLTSVREDEGGTPLFATPTLANGTSATVDGAADLPAGTYPYYCTIHPTQMRGTLTVLGPPDTRAPSVSATLAVTKRRTALKRNRLPLTVATDEAGGVAARARSMGVTVAKAHASLRPGATTVPMKLTIAGRKLLRRHTRLKITVSVLVTDVANNATVTTATGKLT